ncbi:tubby C-terminal domain-like protein [Staphylococcus xylosus]
MTHYYFKENFFNASKSKIDIYDDNGEVAFELQLFYSSMGQEAMALFGNNKQNFEMTDGHDTFRILQ